MSWRVTDIVFPTLVDDAGRAHPPASTAELERRAGTPGHPSREVFQRLKAMRIQWISTTSVEQLFIRAAVAIPLIIAGLALYPRARLEVGPLFAVLAIGLVLGLINRYAVRAIVERMFRHRLAASLVAEGACGMCGYMLRDLPVSNAERLSCPECGAEWNIARIVFPVPRDGNRPRSVVARSLWQRMLGVQIQLVADDRGNIHECPDVRFETLDAGLFERRGRPQLRTLSRGLRRRRPWRIISYALALVPIAAAALLAAALSPLSAYQLSLLLVSSFGLSGVLGAAIARSEIGVPWTHKRRWLLARGVCPICIEPLDSLPLDSDQKRTCPTCRAAWNDPHGTPPPGVG